MFYRCKEKYGDYIVDVYYKVIVEDFKTYKKYTITHNRGETIFSEEIFFKHFYTLKEDNLILRKQKLASILN